MGAAEGVLAEECGRVGLAAGTAPEAIVGALAETAASQEALAVVAATAAGVATKTLSRAHKVARRGQMQGEAAEIAADLLAARTEYEALPKGDATAATGMWTAARLEMHDTGAAAKAKGALARGEFDGRCPVGNIQCPAVDTLNSQRRENAAEHKRALVLYDDACRAEALARDVAETVRVTEQRRAALLARREVLRARAGVLRAALAEPVESAPSVGEAERAVSTANTNWGTASAHAQTAKDALVRVQRAHERLGALRAQVEAARERAGVLRAAVRLFGRQGAQQKIAEAALGEIEAGANALLREAAIDLSVTVRWAREGQGLAASCDACGAPHPASQKVKRCERCGAERGAKLVERLDVELSDRSGAAEDLAGAALQLAASSWLRAERGVQWGAAFIDEPFSSSDKVSRRAFATHLSAMLRGRFGFEQAFIISHSPDATDAMPGRITIMADEYGSRVEVQ